MTVLTPVHLGRAVGGTGGYPAHVHIFFTVLLVLVGLAVTWFAGYVVYRLYSDQR